MRNAFIATTAAIIVGAPSAYAESFSRNAVLSSDARHTVKEEPNSVISAIVSSLNTSVALLYDRQVKSAEKTNADYSQCPETKKDNAKQSRKPRGGEKNTDKAEPTGPEPIYFGF